jgi:MFS family permease
MMLRGETIAPLRRAVFRALWIASVASNVGTWMQDVGAAWLMTSLTTSPFLVTLVQVGVSLPMFLLAVPAGALADILDRRRLLIFTQTWMLSAAAVLGVVTVSGHVSPLVLLVVTFAMGIGIALSGPAWQAIIAELVPREELPAAVALNSVSFNIARSVGPALGGLLVASVGAGPAFFLNAASFLGTVFVLYQWQRDIPASPLPVERFIGAMRGGLRYVRYTPSLRAVMLRAGSFMLFGIALLALLPLIARHELGRGPTGYGVLLGALGVGAVTGATVLAPLRQRLHVEQLSRLVTIVFALCCIVVAQAHVFAVVCAAMWGAGICWLTLLSLFYVVAQNSVAGWVRARGLAVYLLVFYAAIAVGSAVWGALASRVGPPWALTVAGIGLIVTLPVFARRRLPDVTGVDLSPTKFTPAPHVDTPLDRGPVMVTTRYHVDAADRRAFVAVMRDIERLRRRDGAIGWSLYEDAEDPHTMVEVFLVESWAEHLRQHERPTRADIAVRERVRAFHRGTEPPQVSHYLAVDRIED